MASSPPTPPGSAQGGMDETKDAQPSNHEDPESKQKRQFAWDNGNFAFYMSQKRRKLDQQFASRRRTYYSDSSQPANSNLFDKIAIFVDGKTNPPRDKIQSMVLAYGGSFKNYYVKGEVTHVVVERLPLALIDRYRGFQRAGAVVVKPAWVVKSVEKGQLADVRDFALSELGCNVIGQRQLDVAPSKGDRSEYQSHQGGGPLASNENRNFVRDYFAVSRLSFLGTFKSRYETLLYEEAWQSARCMSMDDLLKAARRLVSLPPKLPETERLIVHIDIDCCFAAAAIARDASLKQKPIVVCHANAASKRASESRSEISSANYLARVRGIKAGMFLGEAIKLCPELVTVGYDFAAYQEIARSMVQLFFSLTPAVQVVSVDEAYLDLTHCEVTDNVSSYLASIPDNLVPILSKDTALQNASPGFQERAHLLARYLRAQLVTLTGCSASAGIGVNMLCARMATKRAKPDGQFALPTKASLAQILEGKPVSEVVGVGWKTRQKLQESFNVTTCDELRSISLERLQQELGGKSGSTLYYNLRGEDSRQLEVWSPRKSVSAECRWGVRFGSGPIQNEKRIAFVRDLAQVVVERLGQATASKMTYCLLKTKNGTEPYKLLGHGQCTEHTKSVTFAPTRSVDRIGQLVLQIHEELQVSNEDLRGAGIQLNQLQFPWRGGQDQAKSLFQFFEEDDGPPHEVALEGPVIEPHMDSVDVADEIEVVPGQPGTAQDSILSADEVHLPNDIESLDPSVLDALPDVLRIGIQERISAARRRSSTARSGGTGSVSRRRAPAGRTEGTGGPSRARSGTEPEPERAGPPVLCIQVSEAVDVAQESHELRRWMGSERDPGCAVVSEKVWWWVSSALEKEQFAVARQRVKLFCLIAKQLGDQWADAVERLSTAFETETLELLGAAIDIS